ISAIVEFLVALVGLGVAIDYSLLIVTRWREERARGRDNDDALVAAVATAGRAVLLSGLTVGIGLVALVVLPEPALRSVGFGGMLIPLVSVAVSLTLLPAVLGSIGPRVDWPRLRRESHASRAWSTWARLVVRRKWLATAVGVAALAVLVVPAFSLTTGQTTAAALANEGSARSAYDKLLAGVGALSVDYQHAIFGSFPLMFGVIAVLTFILLARAFRSILLALKALVLNLLSLAATFGVMTWFWQQGHGSDLVFGISATGAI